MNNIKILVCIVFLIFLVVTSIIKVVISLKDQSTTSFEIDEIDNNLEESNTNTFRSTESIELFFGKFHTMFHN